MFRPPNFPSNNYLLPNEKRDSVLISEDEYRRKIEEGLLINNKICADFLTKTVKSPKNQIVQKEPFAHKKQFQKEQTWSGQNQKEETEDHKPKKEQNKIWEFDFLTIGEENPKVTTISYLNSLGSYQTMGQIIGKNRHHNFRQTTKL